MDGFAKKNSENKWKILNQAFRIEQLAKRAYNEIYENNENPWKAFKRISEQLYPIDDPVNIYLLYEELYNKLELPEKQILARHFGQ